MVRLYLSWPWIWIVTSFPKASSEAACLAFLRAIDATAANAFGVVVVQNFEGVAVEDGDDGTGEVGERGIGKKKEDETCQE